MRKVVEFLAAHPVRTRALVLALLALAAGFVPGLPVDAIDAVIVAALALAGGEGVVASKRAKARKDSAE